MQIIKETGCKEKKNLAVVFYLASLKPYLMIIDTWWTEGRLDELKNEFLIEKYYITGVNSKQQLKYKFILRLYKGEMQLPDGYGQRLLVKSREKSFFLHETISNLIKKDDMVRLLVECSMKAGYTLHILNKMDRTYDMHDDQSECSNYLLKLPT